MAKSNFNFFVILLFIFALAFFLRTYNLFSIPIFVDEAIYIRWAQVMKSVPELRFLPLTDGKQPLFMWSMIPFFKVFPDPLVAGRMVSVFCGLGSLIGIGLLSWELFKNKKITLLSCLFYTISPFSVFFDRMALVDSMLCMFGIWALFLSVKTAKTLRADYAMLAGAALGGAWLTKSPGLFFIMLLPASVIFLEFSRDKLVTAKALGRFAFLSAAAVFIAFVIYNIQRLSPSFHMLALRNKDYILTVSDVLGDPISNLLTNTEYILDWFLKLLPLSIFLFAVLGALIGFKKYKKEVVFLLICSLFPLFIQAEFARVFTARYILFTTPPLFILAALFLKNLEKSSYYFLLLILVLPAIVIDYLFLTAPEFAPLPKNERGGYLEAWTAGTGIREIVDYIKLDHAQNPDKSIIVGTEGNFGTTPEGLQIYIEDVPNVTVTGVGYPIREVDSSLVNAKRSGDRVYLVVNKSRLLGEPEEMGMSLVNSYPKAEDSKGIRDSMLLLEVLDEAVKMYNIKHAIPQKSRD